MLFSNGFAIFSNAVTALICTSITLITLAQLQHDKKSWSLARLTFILGALTALAVIMRFLALTGQSIHDIFVLMIVLTTALPCSMLTFAIDFFGAYCRWRRWVVRFQAAAIILVAIGCLVETASRSPVFFTSVTISPDGLVLYSFFSPLLNYVLVGCAYVGFIAAVQTTISQYWKARSRANLEMLIGMSCVAFGLSIVALPIIERYAFEQIPYAIGAVILIVSTLRYRLFDPISQYNAALKNRAERLALIQRAGQRANMRLEVNRLLRDAVHEIQEQFHYHAVTIYLSNEDNQGYSRVSADSEQSDVRSVVIPRQILYLPNLTQQQREDISTTDERARSALWLPIVFGENSSEQKWIGALELQSTQVNGFSDTDREVLQILAQQLAVAIRNAQLFEEIQQANNAKSDFIGYISHEVRNSLGNIENTIDSMLNFPQFYAGYSLPDAFRVDAVSISNSAKHLNNLLSDIRDFAKMEAGKMDIRIERVDPLPILQQVVRSGESTVRPGVEVHALYNDSLPSVLVDALRLEQILLNLVNNAAKYTVQGQIKIDASVRGQMLEFVVADTGPGIHEEMLARLFQPYAQGNRDLARKYGGAGLGLSISRRLVELQGGVIEARSKEGSGTIIRFTIPLAENL